ncbi:MAG: hypothetical protein EXR62_12785 [Chloroflexi bacterium]|nr:hypothetical protein [Chloroflexota bacterium]
MNVKVIYGKREMSVDVTEDFSITGLILRARRGELKDIPQQGWVATYNGTALNPDGKMKDLGIKEGGTITISIPPKKK